MERKRVSFPNDEDLCTVVCSLPNCADIDPNEALAIWYKKPDFQAGRIQAKQISRQCSNDGHGKYLDGTYAEKSRDAQESLCKWAACRGENARGLERWANKSHGEIRQDDQFKVLMAVLEAQDSMVTYGDGILDWEKLKKVYQHASKVSRHFARMLGKADSFAVAPENRRHNMANAGDSDSVSTTPTEIPSPIKKTGKLSRFINRRDCNDALSDTSTHSLSPIKRLRNRIQGKRNKHMRDCLAERNLNEHGNVIEVL